MGRAIAGIYVLLIFVFAIYGNWWGDYAYRGFAYNLGIALVWPAILIPGLREVLGGLLLLGVLVLLALKRN